MGKLNKLNDFDQNSIVEFYEKGEPLKEISKRFSCTAPTVAVFLRSKGVTIRPKGKKAGTVAPVVEQEPMDDDGTSEDDYFDENDDEGDYGRNEKFEKEFEDGSVEEV